MFNVNGWEILVIAVIALLVLGPDRLPEFMARAGRILAQLRQAADEATSEISREIKAVSEMAEAQIEEATRPGRPPRGGADGGTVGPPEAGQATPDEATMLGPSAAGLPSIAPPAAGLFPPLVDGASSGDETPDGDAVPDDQSAPDADVLPNAQSTPRSDEATDDNGSPPMSAAGETPPNAEGDGVG